MCRQAHAQNSDTKEPPTLRLYVFLLPKPMSPTSHMRSLQKGPNWVQGIGQALSFCTDGRNAAAKAAATQGGSWPGLAVQAWPKLTAGHFCPLGHQAGVSKCFWQHGAPAGAFMGPLVRHGGPI